MRGEDSASRAVHGFYNKDLLDIDMSLIDPLFYSLDVIKGRRQPDSELHEVESLALDLLPSPLLSPKYCSLYAKGADSQHMCQCISIVV